MDADGAQSSKRGNENADDTGAEETGAAMIESIEMRIAEMTEDLSEDQRDQEKDESDGGDSQEYSKRR
jgi:hypothetical protein